MDKLTSIAILMSLLPLFLSYVYGGGAGEVCFPFGPSESSVAPPQNVQARPGKIGPPGPPGSCSCDLSEISQLREEIRQQNDRIDRLYDMANQQRNTNGRSRTIATRPTTTTTATVRPTTADGTTSHSDRILLCGVGLKDGRVRDQDFTASSYFDTRLQPQFARLDRQGNGSHTGGWAGSTRGSGEWLQVDLRKPTRVVAVVTQGLNYLGSDQQWVTSYKISYANSTTSMQVIQNENGNDLIFNGNTDRDTHVTNEFPSPITARYFRLLVQTWHEYGIVRLEYLIC